MQDNIIGNIVKINLLLLFYFTGSLHNLVYFTFIVLSNWN